MRVQTLPDSTGGHSYYCFECGRHLDRFNYFLSHPTEYAVGGWIQKMQKSTCVNVGKKCEYPDVADCKEL